MTESSKVESRAPEDKPRKSKCTQEQPRDNYLKHKADLAEEETQFLFADALMYREARESARTYLIVATPI